MSKQDIARARTPADLENRYRFGRAFAEIIGICDDTRRAIAVTEEEIKKLDYELSFRLSYDDNDKIVSMLNASADIINIKGNRLSIESTNFSLAEDGTITALSGMLGGLDVSQCSISDCTVGKCTIDDCIINDTCEIKGTLTSRIIHSSEDGVASISYTESGLGMGVYTLSTKYAVLGLTDSEVLGGSVTLQELTSGNGFVADAYGVAVNSNSVLTINAPDGANINGDPIVTESVLTAIYNRLEALEGA